MLGEFYCPQGLAWETSAEVLEVKNPRALNVAKGCSNGCGYCYGPGMMRESRESWLNVRLPRKEPVLLVARQLARMQPNQPDGVLLSFITDPFLEVNRESTEQVIKLLLDQGIRVATLSKMAVSRFPEVRHGITLVSVDLPFACEWEPNVPFPRDRVQMLREASERGEYVWVSMEPYPCSAIWKQPLIPLLEELKFVDLIIFGKWNYDPRAKTPEARAEYTGLVQAFKYFCLNNNIRYHVKSDTLKFINEKKGE